MEKNIMEMQFPYPLGERRSKDVPDGAWRFIWSHLTYEVKKSFCTVFYKEEGNSEFNIKERLSTSQWITVMENYQYALQCWQATLDTVLADKHATIADIENGNISCTVDPQSLELYPNRFKRGDGEYEKCNGCGNEYPANKLTKGFCSACLYKKGETVKCKICGATKLYSYYALYVKMVKIDPKGYICRKCATEIGWQGICVDCGSPISLTKREVFFYQEKGYSMPKRCKACKERLKKSKSSFNRR